MSDSQPKDIKQPDSEMFSEMVTKRRAIAEAVEQSRTGVFLTGQIKDGKVILDQACLDKIARESPNANISFIAVNAPFDPQSLAVV